MVVSM